MQTELERFFTAAGQDTALQQALRDAGPDAGAQLAVAGAFGYAITAADIETYLAQASDAQLDTVVGGKGGPGPQIDLSGVPNLADPHAYLEQLLARMTPTSPPPGSGRTR